jgi:heme A synthase
MRRAHGFALLTTAATFVLLLVGGVVHGTGSGLACPDWPTCHGTFFPEMRGGVFFEHTHRLVASAVGLLTLVLAALLWRPLRGLGITAAALVVVQGVLGGMTVLLRLPPEVSTAHLGVSMLFFGLMVVICFRTRTDFEPAVVSAGARSVAGAAVVAVYAQILLGAWVRHRGAGLACMDIPLCDGALWPAFGLARLHMLHRIGAVIAGVLVVAAALANRGGPGILRVALPALVAGQMVLGGLSVVRGLHLVLITAHLGLGALLWAGTVAQWLSVRSVPGAATAPVAEAAR